MLHVHLTDAAIRGASGEAVGRCGNTRSPISAAQIRQRCGDHDTEGYKIIRDHTGTHPVEDP